MSRYMARVDELAEAEGISTKPNDQGELLILEDEVQTLEAENAGKRETLRVLAERLEIARAELAAEKELSSKYQQDFIDDLEKCTEKYNVLNQYISMVQSGPDFRINKFGQELEVEKDKYYRGCGQILAKAREIGSEVQELRALQKKCDELKEKTGHLEE